MNKLSNEKLVTNRELAECAVRLQGIIASLALDISGMLEMVDLYGDAIRTVQDRLSKRLVKPRKGGTR